MIPRHSVACRPVAQAAVFTASGPQQPAQNTSWVASLWRLAFLIADVCDGTGLCVRIKDSNQITLLLGDGSLVAGRIPILAQHPGNHVPASLNRSSQPLGSGSRPRTVKGTRFLSRLSLTHNQGIPAASRAAAAPTRRPHEPRGPPRSERRRHIRTRPARSNRTKRLPKEVDFHEPSPPSNHHPPPLANK